MMTINTFLFIIQMFSIVTGLFIFIKGFFPYKITLHGFSEEISPIQAPFNRLIFILIDALRSDFVFSNNSSMAFTQSLIFSGKAYPYTAYASSPTVTLPRIKALTTGSIPVFLDIILNIVNLDTSSTLINQDSWPAQIVLKGGKIVMYGDDTWIKLFPGLFFRSEGTSSFYDFIEVDTNVTRNIYPEMQRTDWDALILHYLGLDHIGHLGGPYSPHMPSKQIEMDHIIKDIYRFIEKQDQNSKFNTLLVVCGDHGMNHAGNHGGSSKSETSTALLFISPFFSQKRPLNNLNSSNNKYQYYFPAQQLDIIPTMAFLLGFNIPKNSLGVMLPELLDLWQVNYNQLSKLLKTVYNALPEIQEDQSCSYIQDNIKKLACLEKHIKNLEDQGTNSEYLKEQYFNFMKTLQKAFSIMSTNYNTNYMILGIFINWNRTGQKFSDLSDIAKYLFNKKITLLVLVTSAYIYLYFKLLYQTFYTLSQGYGYLLSTAISLVAFLCKIILETKSGQFGIKWSSLVDYWTNDYFDLIIFSRLTFFTIFIGVIIFLLTSFKKLNGIHSLIIGLHPLLSIFLITENRMINIPLFVLFHLQLDIIASYDFNPELISLISLISQHYSFFALGNSNSISSIDLSNAYIGIKDYNVIHVGILTYISNWSGPLWWYFGCLRLFSKEKYQKNIFFKFTILLTIFYTILQTFLFISCYILRNHIFIWTVFSPKILYHSVWLILHNLTCTFFGYSLWKLMTKTKKTLYIS
ncbi:hypothetical protein PCANB_000630 [Pneumocystis canis]|nr:hypothetical protein PCANB_000630 [Pneumocystis canis]